MVSGVESNFLVLNQTLISFCQPKYINEPLIETIFRPKNNWKVPVIIGNFFSDLTLLDYEEEIFSD